MENWTKQEKLIYDLISRRFLGMFFPDRDVNYQSLKTEVDGKIFLFTGEKVIDSDWSEVDTSRSSRIQELPELEEGCSVSVITMRLRSDETKPPAPHTEASLLAAMEHAGIGI